MIDINGFLCRFRVRLEYAERLAAATILNARIKMQFCANDYLVCLSDSCIECAYPVLGVSCQLPSADSSGLFAGTKN